MTDRLRHAIDRPILAILVVVHAGLALVGLAGFVEMAWPDAPWPALGDPLFPAWLLALQWTVMVAGGALLVVGALRGWGQRLPRLMAGAYAAMASVCAIETFGYLQHEGRFVAFALECTAYAVILAFLAFRRAGSPPTSASPPGPALPSAGSR